MTKDEIKALATAYATAKNVPLEEVREMYAYWKDETAELLAYWQRETVTNNGSAVGINARIRAQIADKREAA